jgi:hypothetical protein
MATKTTSQSKTISPTTTSMLTTSLTSTPLLTSTPFLTSTPTDFYGFYTTNGSCKFILPCLSRLTYPSHRCRTELHRRPSMVQLFDHGALLPVLIMWFFRKLCRREYGCWVWRFRQCCMVGLIAIDIVLELV